MIYLTISFVNINNFLTIDDMPQVSHNILSL